MADAKLELAKAKELVKALERKTREEKPSYKEFDDKISELSYKLLRKYARGEDGFSILSTVRLRFYYGGEYVYDPAFELDDRGFIRRMCYEKQIVTNDPDFKKHEKDYSEGKTIIKLDDERYFQENGQKHMDYIFFFVFTFFYYETENVKYSIKKTKDFFEKEYPIKKASNGNGLYTQIKKYLYDHYY